MQQRQLQKNYRSRLYALSEGINSLLMAGDPLLTLVTTLDEREIPKDQAQLRDNIVFELNIFDRQLKIAEYDDKLIHLSRQIMIFFIEQRLRRIAEWGDFALSEQSPHLTLAWFKDIVAKILAKQLESLPLAEFVYTWLKTNPWILDEEGGDGHKTATAQARDLSLLITGKLYNIIRDRRVRNSEELLIGDWNTTGGGVIRAGSRNLGSPFWWLGGLGVLLFALQLVLGSIAWRQREPVASAVVQAAFLAAAPSCGNGPEKTGTDDASARSGKSAELYKP